MKKLNRATSLMLALIMLASTACGGSGVETVDTTVSDETVDSIRPAFEKCDYGGEKLNILAIDWGMYANVFFADEATGDVMNDAIYERQIKTEEYLNIDFTRTVVPQAQYKELSSMVETAVMAGDDTYQLALTHVIAGVADMALGNMLYDWNNLEYVDFSKDYWNKNCNDALALNGKQFYTISDFMIPDPNGILFNKDMIESYKLENPYELVRSGKWTLDKMTEMAGVVTSDINGDTVYDFNDQYGVACSDNWEWCSFIYSSGLRLIEKDESGNMQIGINNERMVSLIEKIDLLVNRTNYAHIWKVATQKEDTDKLKVSTGRVLFQIEALNRLDEYRDTEVDFGILPYPKLDESQERYETNDWSGLMCIPSIVGNPEMVGKAAECLALYSGETVVPTYYNVLLGEKLSRDADSVEMLELIFDNIVFDPGVNYLGFTNHTKLLFYTIAYGVIAPKQGVFASWYAQHGPGSEGEIADFAAKVAALK